MENHAANNLSVSVHYSEPLAIKKITDCLITALPKHIHHIIVLCIGTDRSTGDSLGPMTGTLINKMKPKYLTVYGTLHQPVHAINLDSTIKKIHESYENAFIIAIDASLGKVDSIGQLYSGFGPILPGSALKKKLTAVGDIHIAGVVNIAGLMEYTVLQSTRLSLIYDMSKTLSTILFLLDNWLHTYFQNKAKNSHTAIKINNQYTL